MSKANESQDQSYLLLGGLPNNIIEEPHKDITGESDIKPPFDL